MLRTEKIDAVILTCAVDILAMAGDELVVVDGAVVAVRSRSAAPQASSKKPVAQKSGLPLPTQADVLRVLADGPATAGQIADRLDVPIGDSRRHPVTEMVCRMRDSRRIVVHPTDRVRKQMYTLPTGEKK